MSHRDLRTRLLANNIKISVYSFSYLACLMSIILLQGLVPLSNAQEAMYVIMQICPIIPLGFQWVHNSSPYLHSSSFVSGF